MSHPPTAAVWFISAVLVEAAVIDGLKLRVPNWLTYHLAVGGLAFAGWTGAWTGFFWSILGLGAGLGLLLPLYAIGGMGAGDVKLLAGVGAWVGPALILGAFVSSAVVGGVLALGMIALSGEYVRHFCLFQTIGQEIIAVRDPAKLARTAAARKPTMLLLPYGIPIALGSIVYFAWMGLLI